jgi:hypothetical protein
MEVKVTGSSVTLQTTYKTAQCYNPKMHAILLTEPSDNMIQWNFTPTPLNR